jgi:hypothetical protein
MWGGLKKTKKPRYMVIQELFKCNKGYIIRTKVSF